MSAKLTPDWLVVYSATDHPLYFDAVIHVRVDGKWARRDLTRAFAMEDAAAASLRRQMDRMQPDPED